MQYYSSEICSNFWNLSLSYIKLFASKNLNYRDISPKHLKYDELKLHDHLAIGSAFRTKCLAKLISDKVKILPTII